MTRQNRRPHRVLMTADAVGGVWAYALGLARSLGARAEILLAVMGPPPGAAQREAAAALPNLRLVAGDFRLEWMRGAEADLAPSGRWLQELAAAFRPDLVHLNSYAHAALGWGAPVLVVAHSCVLSWWHSVHGEAPPPEWDSNAARVALGLARADRVVAPSRAMLSALEAHYGFHGGEVIANGSSLAPATPRPKEKFILAAGRLWDEGKNLATLDAAASRLAWPVLVAGDCRHPDGRLAAPRAARALGPLAPKELAECMARAAVYALPARYEPFGLSVLEAAVSGCALVLGDIPSLRELWQNAALFVAPNDEAALAAAIDRLMTDDASRLALAAAARRRARRYSLAAMARRYLALYGEMTQPALAEAG